MAFYRLRWRGLFGQNTIFGGEIGICLSKIHPSLFSSGILMVYLFIHLSGHRLDKLCKRNLHNLVVLRETCFDMA